MIKVRLDLTEEYIYLYMRKLKGDVLACHIECASNVHHKGGKSNTSNKMSTFMHEIARAIFQA